MQERERKDLVEVLGLKVEENQKTEEVILDSDDEPLHDNHDNDGIYVESDEEDAGGASSRVVDLGSSEGEQSQTPGWGECPMCGQLFRLPELQRHSMACQVTHGGA